MEDNHQQVVNSFSRKSPWTVASFDLPPPTRTGASLEAQMVKNLPIIQETRVGSLGQEDPLEKEMATHSSVLAWRVPRMGIQSMGLRRVRYG